MKNDVYRLYSLNVNFYSKEWILPCLDDVALRLLGQLQTCDELSEATDVHLESYLTAWGSVQRLLEVMGTVFKFVASDVRDKGISWILTYLRLI